MPSHKTHDSKLQVLDAALRPRSIAVVGASGTPGKLGFTVLKNILANGYAGKVYPINPNDPEIQGLKCYRSVLDVPDEIDAAVILVPAKLCAQVAEECGKKGVQGLIVITSGFSEVGPQGPRGRARPDRPPLRDARPRPEHRRDHVELRQAQRLFRPVPAPTPASPPSSPKAGP